MEQDILNGIWPEWRIVRQIGRGSYGAVYEAVRCEFDVETRAAVKVISIPQNDTEIDSLRSEGLSEEETRTYFENVVYDFIKEIQLTESLKGTQNIVSVEDYKVIEKTDMIGWEIYIRMELLTPFNNYIRGKKLSEKEVIKLGCDICTALELCAKRKIIHRDIKPENIFVNDFGDFKLGDFGIARKMEELTGNLSQKGTYNYMAPEIEKGLNYDSTIDLYSLGLVLYRLMNDNRLPFLYSEKQLLNPNERMEAVRRRMSGEPLPAPCDASEQMTNVILKACAPEPSDRYPNATAMKDALMGVEGVCFEPEEDVLNQTVRVRKAAEPEPLSGTVSLLKSENASGDKTISEPETCFEAGVSPEADMKSEAGTSPEADMNSEAGAVNESEGAAFGQKKKSKAPMITAAVLAVFVLVGACYFFLPRGESDGGDSQTIADTEQEAVTLMASADTQTAGSAETELTEKTEVEETAADKSVATEAKYNPSQEELNQFKKSVVSYNTTKGTAKTACYVRDTPSTAGTEVADLKKGEKVVVTAGVTFQENKTWYKVKTEQNQAGYVAGNLLQAENPVKKIGSKTKYIYTADGSAVNIREKPSTKADAKDKLGYGTKIVVTGKTIDRDQDGHFWYKIRKSGYVRDDMTVDSKPQEIVVPQENSIPAPQESSAPQANPTPQPQSQPKNSEPKKKEQVDSLDNWKVVN